MASTIWTATKTQSLTFGVEFELAVASLEPDQALPDPLEKRTLHFTPIEDDYDLDYPNTVVTWRTVARSIAKTLIDAGYKTTIDNADENTYTTWDITIDPSIESPVEAMEARYESYRWHQIEIRSPVLIFCDASLQAVEAVCAILASRYCTNSNESTGLHVHIGYGNQGFEFDTVRKLVAFLWAFEPQINSLHPQDRFDLVYCQSMRESSRVSAAWQEMFGRRITPRQGTKLILRCRDEEMLLRAISDFHGFYMAYKFPTFKTGRGEDNKPTIEFRQHQGTLNGEAVSAWVRTVAAIVDFVKTNEEEDLKNLFTILEHERWEKTGGSIDVEREREMGPILAEDGFTIIDLLKVIGAYSAALYYKKRGIHKIQKRIPNPVGDMDPTPDGSRLGDPPSNHGLRVILPETPALNHESPSGWDTRSNCSEETLIDQLDALQIDNEESGDNRRLDEVGNWTATLAAALENRDTAPREFYPERASSITKTPPGYEGPKVKSEWESFKPPLLRLKKSPPPFHDPFKQPLRSGELSPEVSPTTTPLPRGASSSPRPRPAPLAPLFCRNSTGKLEDTGRRGSS